jgi:hypothetical protein
MFSKSKSDYRSSNGNDFSVYIGFPRQNWAGWMDDSSCLFFGGGGGGGRILTAFYMTVHQKAHRFLLKELLYKIPGRNSTRCVNKLLMADTWRIVAW